MSASAYLQATAPRPACPDSLAFFAGQLHLRFEGEQEGFLTFPAQWLFTDMDPTSAAYGTTFSVFADATPADLTAKTQQKRAQFASPATLAA